MIRVTPLGDPADRLVLRERDGAFDVVLGGVVLLSSAALETERAFGVLARELVGRAPRRVLVGGLGFGATVRGVLDVADADTRVVVVEKVDAIVELTRGRLATFSGDVLSDSRVELVRADVSDAIASARDLDAILLDVDNGPGWASFRTNARLYGTAGLRASFDALTRGGALAVWSGYPADAFLATLRANGFVASTIPLVERGVVRARAYVGKKP